MAIPKLMLLLSCVCYTVASHHHQHSGSYIIPIEGYESELQDLGQHVEIPETPVKVIKITKTIAVKVPVPYPVKVREKVPYPVQVAKPYPVPVPQIIKVPHIVTAGKSSNNHEGSSVGSGQLDTHRFGQEGDTYQVQEPQSEGHSFGSAGQSFGGGNSDHGQNLGEDFSYEGSPGNSYGSVGSSYDAPVNSYQGYSGHVGGAAGESDESQSYDQAIQDYFNKQKPSGSQEGSSYHY